MRDGDEGQWLHGIAHGAPFHHGVLVFHLSEGKLEESVCYCEG